MQKSKDLFLCHAFVNKICLAFQNVISMSCKGHKIIFYVMQKLNAYE